jgi:2-phospho-L-lactate/phosphoenolpyruvate guanylyltransferase
MHTFAIIPVKPLAAGKSRLATQLSHRDRLRLNRFLFDRTLATATEYPGADRTIVVSRSDEVLDMARSRGMIILREAGGTGLNAALGQATRMAMTLQAGAVLVLPVDLPLTTPDRLRAVVEDHAGPVLVLVPDRHGSGTNLLYQRPIRLTVYQFGSRSIDRHSESGSAAGLRVIVRRDPTLGLDIDVPNDLAEWMERRRFLAPGCAY